MFFSKFFKFFDQTSTNIDRVSFMSKKGLWRFLVYNRLFSMWHRLFSMRDWNIDAERRRGIYT